MPTKLYGLTESDRSRIIELLRNSGVSGDTIPGRTDFEQQLAKRSFKCTAACPAYGVMRITAVSLNSSNWPRFTTAQPNTTFCRFYLVNGPVAAVDGGDGFYYGCGTFLHDGGHVLYDTANTPAFGESWGPQNGAWTITKNRWGFDIFGGTAGSGSTSRVVAKQYVVNHILGKTASAHAKGASGTINLYAGVLGSETSISMTVTAWNRYVALGSGKWAECSWVNGWSVTAGEC